MAPLPSWRGDAACREHPEIEWVPVSSRENVTAARAVCGECLVADQCLEWALAQDNNLEGVWAGTTQRQRKDMRARAKGAA
jgi:WhiB family transcriptional regulator, redox-sensing transcriptional regulator